MWLLPNGEVEQGGDRYKEVPRTAEIGRTGQKSRGMARTAMPQLLGKEIATGELALVTGDTR